jgi:hypothetical protein
VQKPSIGRVVHFVQDGVHYAATIVVVWSDSCVNLCVLPNGWSAPGGAPFTNSHPAVITSVVYGAPEENRDNSWHWPEIV